MIFKGWLIKLIIRLKKAVKLPLSQLIYAINIKIKFSKGVEHRLYKLTYRITSNQLKRDKLVIVTGADSSHYKSLCQFLSHLLRHEPIIKVVVFDLGLSNYERQYLSDNFLTIDLRRFDYAKYPDYFNIKINSGQYAWKPVILADILNEFKCCVCWMDAGNVVTKPLLWLRKTVKKVGIYSPTSSGRISDWTHPATLKYFNVSKHLLYRKNLNGACVAVCYQHQPAREIIAKWKACALSRDCIAPMGSNRRNHRQDQAVLSIIAHQSNIGKKISLGHYEFKIHQDIDDRNNWDAYHSSN